MALKEKAVSSAFFEVVDPIANALDGITNDTKKVIETGVNLQVNFRQVAIGLRKITRRTTMKLLSSALSFATPVDIEKIVEDITESAMTVYKFVKNSGLCILWSRS